MLRFFAAVKKEKEARLDHITGNYKLTYPYVQLPFESFCHEHWVPYFFPNLGIRSSQNCSKAIQATMITTKINHALFNLIWALSRWIFTHLVSCIYFYHLYLRYNWHKIHCTYLNLQYDVVSQIYTKNVCHNQEWSFSCCQSFLVFLLLF